MHARRRLFAIVSAAALPAAIFACGSDSKKKVDSGIHLDDTNNNGGSDGTSGACTASTSYAPNFGSNQAAETNGSGTMHVITYDGVLNMDATPDFLQLELYAGFGAFMGTDIKPGTYQITGAEANYETCGVCVRIFTDVDTQAGMAADDYFANGGTVTLTSVSGSNFTGTLSNITLDHVTIDPNTFHSTPVGDCTSSISSATMMTALTVGSGFTRPITGRILTKRHY